MSMKQTDCVYGIISNMMEVVPGVKTTPTPEQLKEIYELVTSEIVSGNCDYSPTAKNQTPEDIRKKYVPGMVSNTLRKDKRLNGGEKYETKNPGSRAGSGDEQLRNLKALKTLHPEHSAAIDEQIAVRLAEIATPKKQVTVDLDKIPAELRAQLGL